MTFREIPRDIKDEKDMESFLRALRENAVSTTSHSELKDIKEADKSSTDTTQNRHVSDYDMKRIEDHMVDTSKHLEQTLPGDANYLSSINAASNKILIAGTGNTRNIDVDPDKLGGAGASSSNFLRGDEIWSTPTEGEISLSDVTTLNVSTTKHGFAPKLPNDATKFLDGTGAYAVPAGTTYTGGDNIEVSGTTINQRLEYGAYAYRAGFQTITTSTWTKIQFDSMVAGYIDNDFDPLTNNDYTAPVAGYYHVDILGGIIALADGAEMRVAIYLNGTIVSYNNSWSPSATADPRVLISKDIKCAANDKIEGYIWHNHGSNRNTISDNMYITVHYIG